MTDVTIPADVAKRNALNIRSRFAPSDPLHDLADLLDPKPPTLRAKVAEALRVTVGCCDDCAPAQAHVAVDVIADEMAKRPLLTDNPPTYGANPLSLHHRSEQRDADVAWLLGKDESEATFWCVKHRQYHAHEDGTCPERGEQS